MYDIGAFTGICLIPLLSVCFLYCGFATLYRRVTCFTCHRKILPQKEIETVVILGSGWATFSLLLHLNRRKYRVVVISTTNHFLFTPLLADCAFGALNLLSITQTIPYDCIDFIHAEVTDVNFDTQEVFFKSILNCSERTIRYYSSWFYMFICFNFLSQI